MMELEETYEQKVERTGGYPIYVAHRAGGGTLGPENTIYVAQQSLLKQPIYDGDASPKGQKIRMLEVDIRLTRDGQLILMHDSSVDRTTDGQGAVNQHTLADLQRLDAAFLYPALRHLRIKVPTLKEFLDTFVDFGGNTDLLFMFDFKDVESVELALPLIESYALLKNRYILGSVFAIPNARLRERRVSKEVQVVSDISDTIAIAMAHRTGLWSLHPFGKHEIFGYVLQSHSGLFFTESLIRDLKERQGMRVMACGVLMSLAETREFCLHCRVDYMMVEQL